MPAQYLNDDLNDARSAAGQCLRRRRDVPPALA
jgi:hypothetical protein